MYARFLAVFAMYASTYSLSSTTDEGLPLDWGTDTF